MLSFWEKESWFQEADVVIAGAGLAGLWTAYELRCRRPELRVVIMERSAIPMGASTRNAGFACFGSPGELMADAGSLGRDTMLDIVDMRFRGIQKIRQILGDERIGFEATGGFECFEEETPDMKEAVVQLNEWLRPVTEKEQTFQWVNNPQEATGMKGFGAMVGNSLEGGLHSGKLVSSLTQKVMEMGVTVFYGAEVKGWQMQGSKIAVDTSRGPVHAGCLALTTNAWLSEYLPEGRVLPARGQIVVTKPLPGFRLSGTFHFDEGYYYWRNLGNRMLLGGARNRDKEGETTLEPDISAIIQHSLEMFLMKHFPDIFHEKNISGLIELRWGGLMAMSHNRLPVLEQMEPGVFAMCCCNGMGVALTPIFAETLAEAVCNAG